MREPADPAARQADLASARLRPGFEVELPVPPDEVCRRLREGLEVSEPSQAFMAAGRHFDLLVGEAGKRVWSPHLTIEAEEAPHGSTLRCRFSPRPEIWTGFMFVYSFAVFAILFGATLGYVQQVSDETRWGYLAVAAGFLVIGGIHLAGYVGQRLAAGQMRELRGRLDALIARQFDSVSPTDQRS